MTEPSPTPNSSELGPPNSPNLREIILQCIQEYKSTKSSNQNQGNKECGKRTYLDPVSIAEIREIVMQRFKELRLTNPIDPEDKEGKKESLPEADMESDNTSILPKSLSNEQERDANDSSSLIQNFDTKDDSEKQRGERLKAMLFDMITKGYTQRPIRNHPEVWLSLYRANQKTFPEYRSSWYPLGHSRNRFLLV